MDPEPRLALQFHRDVALSPAQVWGGWTNPDTLVK
jgi:uncharacterized protein YndB with AHSA1/START domain